MSKLQQLIQLIHQGNYQALAAFLNGHLNSKGLYIKVSLKNDRLNILVEAQNEPPQAPVVKIITNGFKSHQFRYWPSLKIYGKKQGEEFPEWVEDIDILSIMPTLEDLAKQGDMVALQTLLAESIKDKINYSSLKLSRKNSILRIRVEKTPVPIQEETVRLITASLQKVAFPQDLEVHIYGQEIEEDFPDWHSKIIISSDVKETLSQEATTYIPVLQTKVQELKQENSPASSDPSQNIVQQSPLATEVDHLSQLSLDPIKLSNDIYFSLNTLGFHAFTHRENELEEESNVHRIVEIFIEDLEDDLKSDISSLSSAVKDLISSLGLDSVQVGKVTQRIEQSRIDILESDFSAVKTSLRNLRKVTREVQDQDFPEDQSLSDIFISGMAEFAGFRSNPISKEAAIGSIVGSIIAPGLGTVLGAAIGEWMSGSKQSDKITVVVEKYTTAKDTLFETWNSLLGKFYTAIQSHLNEVLEIDLLGFSSLEEASQYYQDANELLERIEKDTISDKELLSEKLSEIVSVYDEALKKNPGLAVAWNNKGYVLIELEKYAEALELFDYAIEINEKLVSAYTNKGDALRELDSLELALECYNKALALEPDSAEILFNQALLFIDLENYKAALDNILILLREDQENATFFGVKALCLAHLEEENLALESLEKMAKLDYAAFLELITEENIFVTMSNNPVFVQLTDSSIGIDYSALKSYVKNQNWRQADEETVRLFNSIVSKSSNSDKVSVSAIKKIPSYDLSTIDRIWREFSNGQFGFSIQAEIYQCSELNKEKFGLAVGWCKLEDDIYTWQEPVNSIYDFNLAPKGHLPSLLWAGENRWLEDRMDRFYAVFTIIKTEKELFVDKRDVSNS